MNPTSIYVTTCRLILQAEVEDASSWADIHKSLPSLRDSLSCTVCNHLLMEPYTPTDGDCQHHVCRACKGEKKRLKPACSWCKDYTKYSENVQLRTLLQCYKKMCTYVLSSEFYRTLLANTNSNSTNSEANQALIELLKEGAGFKDDFAHKAGALLFSSKIASVRSTSTQTLHLPHAPYAVVQGRKMKNAVEPLPPSTTYSVVTTSDNGNRLTIKRTGGSDSQDETSTSAASPPPSDKAKKRRGKRVKTPEQIDTKVNRVRNRSVFTNKFVCTCDGTLKKNCCRGYCCPCYSSDKNCENCYCIGCKNPIGVSSGDGPPPGTIWVS